jgi:hypothetical protein
MAFSFGRKTQEKEGAGRNCLASLGKSARQGQWLVWNFINNLALPKSLAK